MRISSGWVACYSSFPTFRFKYSWDPHAEPQLCCVVGNLGATVHVCAEPELLGSLFTNSSVLGVVGGGDGSGFAFNSQHLNLLEPEVCLPPLHPQRTLTSDRHGRSTKPCSLAWSQAWLIFQSPSPLRDFAWGYNLAWPPPLPSSLPCCLPGFSWECIIHKSLAHKSLPQGPLLAYPA